MSRKSKAHPNKPNAKQATLHSNTPSWRVPLVMVVIVMLMAIGLWWVLVESKTDTPLSDTGTSSTDVYEAALNQAVPPKKEIADPISPSLVSSAIAQAAAPALPPTAPSYVGGQHCQSCHQAESKQWKNSHHDLSMQTVNTQTVLGDFNNTDFDYAGTRSHFFKDDKRFMVRTDGADGKLQDFEIKYVFGVEPLQQYLIAQPGGRLQALSIAWDSRDKKLGGQKWFHLYPELAVTFESPLHWSKPSQNWNFMCAECHSTQLNKNYDAVTKTYDTQWAEINVSCEACHGPGSHHISWALQVDNSKADNRQAQDNGLTHQFNERKGIVWQHDASTQQPVRSQMRTTETEIQVCAACHSRRAQLFEDDRQGQAYMDSYLPALLDEGLYHADGQVDAEVYVYGSFIQSKMYAKGVTCSDCHNPHSLAIKVPGDGVCMQCHQSEQYASPQHHFHQPGAAGSQCVDCHMPTKNFMVVDGRRDHSFRIPRPDLSSTLNTPNACNDCHQDKTAQWAADNIQTWTGREPQGFQHFAETLSAQRQLAPDAEHQLRSLLQDLSQPAIARATAASALQHPLTKASVATLQHALQDADPLVRAGALSGLKPLPLPMRWQLVAPLLKDPVRVVRSLAAETLADMPLASLPPLQRSAFEQASQEYITSQLHNADTAAANVNLGSFYTAQGQWTKAQAAYQDALVLDPDWLATYINFADLYRMMQREDEAIAILQRGITQLPTAGDLYHSLGLAYARQQQLAPAIASLAKAALIIPDNAQYTYVYAVALSSNGQHSQALTVIKDYLSRHQDPRLLQLQSQLLSQP
ncbi:tetratricopeptide repeat protein [Oceanisphaera sp. W20_SRM_FM3]|uniref:tetratricopeptide repeat protein n=1 Tax=Oceanisphaera sp. W20_SRM_FM3 TaxID=3240267 RepID=UPI003F9C2603